MSGEGEPYERTLRIQMSLLGLAVALALAIFFFLWGRRERLLLNQIPGLPRFPIIGQFNFFLGIKREDLISSVLRVAFEYGPITYFEVLGVKRILITGPDEMQAILTCKQNLTKDTSYTFMEPWLGTGLLTSAGDKWRSRRRMLNPVFHYKILEEFVHVFNANSAILVDKLRERTTDKYVEINDYVSLCALDVICETAMGTSVNAQKGEGAEYVRAVRRMCELFTVRHLSAWLHPECIYRLSSLGREEKKVVRVLQDFSEKVIKKKRSEYQARKLNGDVADYEDKKRSTFLDMLLEMSDGEGSLTDEDMREEVNTFMFAGHDTTAAAICWVLFSLGSHKEIQDKVVTELSEIFGSDRRQPTMNDLQAMTYMDMVIKEALRLFPSVPAVSRVLDTDLKIGGFTVPAGTNVMLFIYGVHRNPSVYPDPELFDPERFSPEQAAGRHPYAYIPFSAGPRNCIGQKFARLEEKCLLSAILRNYTIEALTKFQDVIIYPSVLLNPVEPFKIKFSERV